MGLFIGSGIGYGQGPAWGRIKEMKMGADSPVVITHGGKTFHAIPYFYLGNPASYLIVSPEDTMKVLHRVEGPWDSPSDGAVDVSARTVKLIDEGRL